MISAMHWYFKFTQPLVLQSVPPIKNLLTNKVALIHLWGDAAEGQLQRPFKAKNPFAAMLGGAGADKLLLLLPLNRTITRRRIKIRKRRGRMDSLTGEEEKNITFVYILIKFQQTIVQVLFDEKKTVQELKRVMVRQRSHHTKKFEPIK